MLVPAALSALLVVSGAVPDAQAKAPVAPPAAGAAAPVAPAASAGKTLWLVQPLYPGQELLVSRTEEALRTLLPEGGELVGRSALASIEPDAAKVTDCVFGAARCDDPVGTLVAAWGADRVVLVKAGQDDAGYRFRVASFQPGAFESATAESANATLEKALLGALIKVVPLASTLEIATDPPGATVLLDGERVGVTPLSAQALPGDHLLRLELASHEVAELPLAVPVRGSVRIERDLAVLPATLALGSTGATLLVDGKAVGTEKAEVAVAAGTHKVRFERDGFEPWETQVEVKPGQTLAVDHSLEATGWHSFGEALAMEQEAIYARGSYASLTYDSFRLTADALRVRSLNDRSIKSNSVTGTAALWGISFEYGSFWRWFGLMTFGASYFQSQDAFTLGLTGVEEGSPASADTLIRGGSLRLLQPQLRVAIWRFTLGAQGGFVGRIAHGSSTGGYDRGFLLADLGLDAQGTVQAWLVDGLFLEGAYRQSFTLAGSTDGTQEFRGGLGYAF